MDFKPGEKLKDYTLTGNGNYETTFRPRSRRERADEPPPPPAPPQPTGDELDLDPEIEYAFDVEEPMAGRDRCRGAEDDGRRLEHAAVTPQRGSALTSPASF